MLKTKKPRKPRKPKPPSRSKLKADAVEIATRLAKHRDKHQCVKCGVYCSGSNEHGSHIIPRSADGRLAMHPANIFCMCMHCHLYWWHKNPLEASEWMEQAHARRAEWLREQVKYNKVLGAISISWMKWWIGRLKELEAEVNAGWSEHSVEAFQDFAMRIENHLWVKEPDCR